MRVHLRGIHTVLKTLADGAQAVYRYAWRGGPRLEGEPGTPDFMASYNAALEKRRTPVAGVFFTLISEYRASSEYLGLRASTRHDYARYLKLIEAEFGDTPLEALADQRIRGDFKAWRDKMAATPRAADLAWSVLARVLSVAKDRGRIDLNPCERGGRLYKADRADLLWTDDMIAAAVSSFPKALRWALMLALWTGQRQGDLLRLPWSAYQGGKIRMRQSKTGARVAIPVGLPLRLELEGIPRLSPVLLTSSRGTPWTGDGFRSSWGKACDSIGVTGVTFHDLRGSAVTRLAEAGATVPEIASITGHSLDDVNAILDSHYLSHTNALAESAIHKLERRNVERTS